MQAVHVHDHSHDHEHEHDHDHRAETAQAWLKTLLLFGLGVYFTYNIASGNLTNYINVRFAWLSYAAAALFLLLGLASAVGLLRQRGHDHPHDHDHGGRMSWLALVVVSMPLVLGTLIPSRPLGAAAVDGNLSMNTASGNITTMMVTIQPLDRNILDWIRVFNMTADYTTLAGESADVTGFIYREPSFGSDQMMVARFTISCCVADASAIGIPVQADNAAQFATDSWVRVQGQIEVGDFRGDSTPILRATRIEQVEQPEHPYLYP
jgi:uncharacterized repeat protein (TIGR03943 family)